MTSETLEKWPKGTMRFFPSTAFKSFGLILIISCWIFLYFHVIGSLYDGIVQFLYSWNPPIVKQTENAAEIEDATSDAQFTSLNYYLICGLGGLFACGITHTAIVPLDLLKCRIQVDPLKYKGVINGCKVTIIEEGFLALAKGWAPTTIGYCLQGLGKFGFYEAFKTFYGYLLGQDLSYQWRTSVYLLAAASAEFIADIMLAPMEATKVRIQTQPNAPQTLLKCVQMIYKTEGFSGFFKGLPPLWMRQIPYTMMKFACFERTVEFLYLYFVPIPRHLCTKEEQLIITFIAGYIAGVFCAIVSHPADTIVSKLNQSSGSSAFEVAKKLGSYGLWKGLFARILMVGTLTALQWFIYESVKAAFGLPSSQIIDKSMISQ